MFLRGVCGLLLLALFASSIEVRAQRIPAWERDLAQAMLDNVSSDVRDNYFDSKLGGLGWTDLVQEAKKNIAHAPSMESANAQIAGLLERLNGSHTRFLPPRNLAPVDYGWNFQMIGDHAYITEVSRNSDAETLGLSRGEELLTINGFKVDRASARKLKYAMDVIAPRTSVRIDLLTSEGTVKHLNIGAKVKKELAVAGLGDASSLFSNQQTIDLEKNWESERAEIRELSSDLIVLRIPAFVQVGSDVDSIFKKVRGHKALIVDLRGTPGGRLDSVESFLSGIFDRDVNVGASIGRYKTRPLIVKGKRRGAFGGDLIVLIDSESASGAEVFARVVQLEERGTILGDQSAGSVMEARFFPHQYGENPVYSYSTEIAIADTRMSDGKSLEGIGVQPDRKFLPGQKDIAENRDPVLAYAAGLAGVKLSSEDADKLFPGPQALH